MNKATLVLLITPLAMQSLPALSAPNVEIGGRICISTFCVGQSATREDEVIRALGKGKVSIRRLSDPASVSRCYQLRTSNGKEWIEFTFDKGSDGKNRAAEIFLTSRSLCDGLPRKISVTATVGVGAHLNLQMKESEAVKNLRLGEPHSIESLIDDQGRDIRQDHPRFSSKFGDRITTYVGPDGRRFLLLYSARGRVSSIDLVGE